MVAEAQNRTLGEQVKNFSERLRSVIIESDRARNEHGKEVQALESVIEKERVKYLQRLKAVEAKGVEEIRVLKRQLAEAEKVREEEVALVLSESDSKQEAIQEVYERRIRQLLDVIAAKTGAADHAIDSVKREAVTEIRDLRAAVKAAQMTSEQRVTFELRKQELAHAELARVFRGEALRVHSTVSHIGSDIADAMVRVFPKLAAELHESVSAANEAALSHSEVDTMPSLIGADVSLLSVICNTVLSLLSSSRLMSGSGRRYGSGRRNGATRHDKNREDLQASMKVEALESHVNDLELKLRAQAVELARARARSEGRGDPSDESGGSEAEASQSSGADIVAPGEVINHLRRELRTSRTDLTRKSLAVRERDSVIDMQADHIEALQDTVAKLKAKLDFHMRNPSAFLQVMSASGLVDQEGGTTAGVSGPVPPRTPRGLGGEGPPRSRGLLSFRRVVNASSFIRASNPNAPPPNQPPTHAPYAPQATGSVGPVITAMPIHGMVPLPAIGSQHSRRPAAVGTGTDAGIGMDAETGTDAGMGMGTDAGTDAGMGMEMGMGMEGGLLANEPAYLQALMADVDASSLGIHRDHENGREDDGREDDGRDGRGDGPVEQRVDELKEALATTQDQLAQAIAELQARPIGGGGEESEVAYSKSLIETSKRLREAKITASLEEITARNEAEELGKRVKAREAELQALKVKREADPHVRALVAMHDSARARAQALEAKRAQIAQEQRENMERVLVTLDKWVYSSPSRARSQYDRIHYAPQPAHQDQGTLILQGTRVLPIHSGSLPYSSHPLHPRLWDGSVGGGEVAEKRKGKDGAGRWDEEFQDLLRMDDDDEDDDDDVLGL